MAMIASSTRSPSARINEPSVIRSKFLPVAAMTMNTAARVKGTAAATTMPTRHPMLRKLTSMTTPRAAKNLTMNSSTDARKDRLAVVADQEGGRVFVAALHFGDVGQLQGAPLRGDRGIADAVQIIESTVQPEEDLRPLGFDRPAGRHDVPAVERGEDVSRGETQGGEAVIGERDG